MSCELWFCELIFQHHVDPAIGVYIIDRYTYYALEFLETVRPDSNQTMGQFVSLTFAILLFWIFLALSNLFYDITYILILNF